MCYMLYLGSDCELPLIPWREEERRVHVSREEQCLEALRRWFQKRLVYYVGADTGCGCGFPWSTQGGGDDPEQRAAAACNIAHLHVYLAACLEIDCPLELYGCWTGDEEQEPEEKREVPLSALLEPDFCFAERQLTRVVRDATLDRLSARPIRPEDCRPP